MNVKRMDPICPKKSICLCEPCFYGRRCHLSTSGFGLLLDAILGYHIEPDLSLSQQSSIVQFSLALIISSITTILISILLVLKFSIPLSAHMRRISSRLFLETQCHSLDFLVRICLHFDQWLTACIAVERTITVIKETRFDKKKSHQSANEHGVLLHIHHHTLNFISAILLITIKSRQQYQQLKNLLIAPVVLVVCNLKMILGSI